MVVSNWTTEGVIALAPDASALRAARGLATARPWGSLGQAEAVVWGECKGSAAQPYRVRIVPDEPAFACSCPSRKQPCKHALGLLFLLAEQPASFETLPPPGWVAEWLAARARRAGQRAEPARLVPTTSGPASAPDGRVAAREARVSAGLKEFERWLTDLIRRGLAGLPAEGYALWERPAARLVDAQAGGLARRLRAVAGVPASGAHWPDRLLERLARLYLLVEAYRRQETLPPPTRADVRALIGWTAREEEALAEPALRDRWLVLGQRIEVEDRLRAQRTWLWGERSGRTAQVLQFAHGAQPFDVALPPPGAVMDAVLAYFPSAYPLRAVIVERHGPLQPATSLPGYPSIADALAAYAAAVTHRPWLPEFPLALENVAPAREDDRWVARDAEGALLPLSPRFAGVWKLLALSGGWPLTLFGEWDGEALLPLSAWVDGGFVSLAGEEPG